MLCLIEGRRTVAAEWAFWQSSQSQKNSAFGSPLTCNVTVPQLQLSSTPAIRALPRRSVANSAMISNGPNVQFGRGERRFPTVRYRNLIHIPIVCFGPMAAQ